MNQVLSKAELYRRMDRYAADEKRLVSWKFLAELAGYSQEYLRDVFLYKTEPLSETMQMRLSKALERIATGEVTLVQWKDRSRELRYNKEPKPRLVKGAKIQLRDGKLSLSMGPINRGDYSEITLKERLGRK